MADVQKYFEDFHEIIKLSDTEENQELREKRDIILNKLKEKKAADVPTYTQFNQGSYAMGTGVKPINGEYDIDVGIRFDISKDDFPDPVTVKKWAYDALNGHTKDVKMKSPCVTVTYQKDGEAEFHVDLAIYAAKNSDGKLYLAKGKLNSNDENKYWEVSDPLGVIDKIKNYSTDIEDRKQFRRIIRYLKRWKDIKFPTGGYAAPCGIGLTVAAYKYLSPNKYYVFSSDKYKYDDLQALVDFVSSLINHFVTEYDHEEVKYVERLHINLFTEPYNDLFGKMTNKQMGSFKSKLEDLKTALISVKTETDPHEACKTLQSFFGDEFPVPPKDDTGQRKANAILSSSTSA